MRLIDADEYKERISHYPTIKAIAFKELRYVKTIEAEPTRHGHWKPYKTEQGRTLGVYCSECRKWLLMNPTPYCPNCGAKMDEEVNENETY